VANKGKREEDKKTHNRIPPTERSKSFTREGSMMEGDKRKVLAKQGGFGGEDQQPDPIDFAEWGEQNTTFRKKGETQKARSKVPD